jgi:glycosyl-4,4'-diaponeurosporenoate acyltransferase
MVPVVRLGDVATVALDVVVWAAIHAGTGYAAHRLADSRLARDSWLTRPRPWERDGRAYEQVAIRRWKDRLPEAGALFPGGVSKRRLPAGGRAALHTFVPETRRAEYAHWWCFALSPLFALWNPPAVAVVMVVYGAAVNAPFIAIQRYNRLRIVRTVAPRSTSTGSLPPSSRRRTGSNMP